MCRRRIIAAGAHTILHVAFVADAPAFHGRASGFERGMETVEAGFNRAVSAGADIAERPERKLWGQLVAYVRDNGFLVEICSPVAGCL